VLSVTVGIRVRVRLELVSISSSVIQEYLITLWVELKSGLSMKLELRSVAVLGRSQGAAPSFLPGLPLFRDPFPNQLLLTAPTKR